MGGSSRSVDGSVAPAYEGMARSFSDASAALAPGGAAMALSVHGAVVVDIWAGDARPHRPWTEDTLAVLMSSTKGISALAIQLCVERGLLDVETPVAKYWPEFAAAGKEGVLVRHILTHTAGLPTLPGYRDFLTLDGRGWDRNDEIARRLAAAAPSWEPGTRAGYHGFTYGWLVAELVRRSTGRSIGAFIRDEIASPLQLDLWVGTPAEVRERVAHVIGPPPVENPTPEFVEAERRMLDPEDPLGAMFFAMDGSNRIMEVEQFYNVGPGSSLELPASGGVATARSLARMYQLLAGGGVLDGVRLLSQDTVTAFASEQFRGIDVLLGQPTRWGFGYQRPGNFGFPPVLDDEVFGHAGFGGQLAFAHPTRNASFAFVSNRLGPAVLAGIALGRRFCDVMSNP